MPVIRRKLALSLARVRPTPTATTRLQASPIVQPPHYPTGKFEVREDQRGMNVKAAARYLGTSAWQVRRWKNQGFLKAFRYPGIEKPKDMFDRFDLDAFLERSKEA